MPNSDSEHVTRGHEECRKIQPDKCFAGHEPTVLTEEEAEMKEPMACSFPDI